MWVALGFLVVLARVILIQVRRSKSGDMCVVAVVVAVVLVLPLAAVIGYALPGEPGDGGRVADERAGCGDQGAPGRSC